MTRKQALSALLVLCCLAVPGVAQQDAPAAATLSNSSVPMLSKFNGTLTDINSKPITTISGVTFSLYAEAEGGAALWMETQNVQPDKNGRYTVTLGSSKSTGLPVDVFVSGQARWLGVQVSGQAEYPRVLLMSVPYALKAADAATIGGLPPSAFMLANPGSNSATSRDERSGMASTGNANGESKDGPQVAYSAVKTPKTPGGSVGYVPLWTTNPNIIGNSNVFQSTSGSNSGFVGLGTNSPLSLLQLATSNPGKLGPSLTLMNTAGLAGAGASVDFDGYNLGTALPEVRVQSFDDGNYSSSLVFQTKIPGAASNGLAERMRIADYGYVGINNNNPSYPLDIGGGDAIVRGADNFQTAYDIADLYVGDANHVIRAENAVGIGIGAFGQFPGVFVADGGNVGIHTTQPVHVFQVAQGAGPAFADSWSTYSSRRWKTNIHELHGALEKVQHLRGVSYDMKEGGQHQIGVIAEEVGAVVPEVVTWEKNSKDAAGVDYARLTALLIEATKEQQKLIQRQQKQLKVQQAKIAHLTTQVSTIQAALYRNGQQNSPVLSASLIGEHE
ncbi:MAG TPA: tail fiber domain-containing protein [Terriglobales bacterium]|nr:tail fiber domain-containing protein [Terriglobales bacterium]